MLFRWQIDILPVYKQYIANYPRALEILLKRKAENQHFANFVDVSVTGRGPRDPVLTSLTSLTSLSGDEPN